MLSIRGWCRSMKGQGSVVVNTASGEQRLDCRKDELVLTKQGRTITVPPAHNRPTAPTITSWLKGTIDKLETARVLQALQPRSKDLAVAWRNVGVANPEFDKTGSGLSNAGGQVSKEKSEIAELCSRLRTLRNLFLKSKGYCFKEAHAVAAFGNKGCKHASLDTLQLSPEENELVKKSMAEEKQSCH